MARRRKMFPSPAITNIRDCASANTVLPGQFSKDTSFGNIGPKDYQNLLIGKFGFPTFDATRGTSLSHHIRAILGSGSREQMRRADTKGIITTRTIMANIDAFWNRTVYEFVRKSMSADSFGLLTNTVMNSHCAITIMVSGSHPQPAVVGFVYELPEPNFKRDNFSRAFTGQAAILSKALSYLARPCKENLIAILADALNFGLGSGIMGLHGNSPFYVTPPATCNSAGVLCC